jgi:hypothetical protein
MSERNPDELGALWEKTGAKGDYLTGEIGGVKVVCFRNTKAHDNPKAPAWRVLKSKPRDEGAGYARPSASPISDQDVPF